MRGKGARRYLEQGVAIITVLLVLSILAVIGLGVATMGQRHMALTVVQANSEKAYMAAEAAALYACDVLSTVTTPLGGQVQMDSAGNLTRPFSPTAGDVVINATTSGWAPSGAPISYKPPGSADPIIIPPEHIYIVGCGSVNPTSGMATTKYVGLLCNKATPGGVFYFGAYGKNAIKAEGNTGVIDAYNSSNTTDPSADYKVNDRVPYADILGSATVCNVADCPNIFGSVDGKTVNATNTNFNKMGTARQPGLTVDFPQPPWPTLQPSPGTYDIQIGGNTKVYLVNQTSYTALHGAPFDPVKSGLPPGTVIENNMHFADLEINGNSQLTVIGTPGGGNYCVNSLFAWEGDLVVNSTDMGPNDHVGFYVNKGGLTDKNLEFTKGAKAYPVDANPNRNNQAKFLNFYFNGDEVRVTNTTTNVIATITAVNPNVICELRKDAHLTGSIISANTITMSENFNLHFDTSLKTPFKTQFQSTDDNIDNQYKGKAIGIISHQRL